MLSRRAHEDALGVVGAQTIIGTGVVVIGNLSTDADVVIDGAIDGNIKAGGSLTISVNGNVKANIEADSVRIAGTLAGDIIASGEAIILETGQVRGNIKSTGLSIAAGGVFIGRSIIVNHPPSLSMDSSDESSSQAGAPGA